MPAQLLDGNALARQIRSELTAEVADFIENNGVVPALAAVLVGGDPASQVYVRNKRRDCEEVGINSTLHRLPDSTTQDELLNLIAKLNRDDSIHGILVQFPLPPHIDRTRVIEAISPEKDVDGFHPLNVGRVASGIPGAMAPCTPVGCLTLIRSVLGPKLEGKTAVVVGRSNIVGRPMASLLVLDGPGGNATVTICHSRTADLGAITRQADILVVAIGKPALVGADMVKPGAAVIDVGTTRVPDTTSPKGYRISGDVRFDEVREVAGWLTPVPGGVGPMTIAMLLRNTLQAATLEAGVQQAWTGR